jgi:hypothetical protein
MEVVGLSGLEGVYHPQASGWSKSMRTKWLSPHPKTWLLNAQMTPASLEFFLSHDHIWSVAVSIFQY